MIAGAARDGSTTSVPLRRIIPVMVAVATGRLSKKSPREPGIHPPMYPYRSFVEIPGSSLSVVGL
jgi:hypothetical protein